MNINITPNTLDYAELETKLTAKFPQYSFKMRNKQFLVGKKSNTVGTNIILSKKKLMVVGSFPTIGGTMVFALCLVLLGILIPLIIYFIAFHSKMKVMEKEIGAYLQEEYEVK